MASSKQAIVWDSVTLVLAAGNVTVQTHRITLPQGTIGWRLTNGDATPANTVEVAGTLATITASSLPGPAPITVPGSSALELLAGQDVYIRNRNNATPPVNVIWWRAERQPDGGAGTATISANLTP